jgi:hypothetical protein
LLTACPMLTASNIHDQNTHSNDHFFFYQRFSIDPRKSYKATNLAFNRQILRFVPYFSNLSIVFTNPCVFSVTFNHVFFTKARLAHALLSISGVICSAATVRQTKKNKMAKVEFEREGKLVYIFVDITLLRHVHHIIAHLNYFYQLLIDPGAIICQEIVLNSL